MFVERIARHILEIVSGLNDRFEIIDFCIGLKYTYVLLKGFRGISLGLAFTPIEDIQGTKPIHDTMNLSIENVESMITSIDPLEKVLGVALINALSGYLLWNLEEYRKYRKVFEENIVDILTRIAIEPIVVIGNMGPIVRRLREHGFKDIIVLERNPCMRYGYALSDTAMMRVLPRAKTLIITGATLVNDTIDLILRFSDSNALKVLVGPTASIYPQTAFDNGIHVVALTRVIDIDKVIELIKLGRGRQEFSPFCRDYVFIRDDLFIK